MTHLAQALNALIAKSAVSVRFSSEQLKVNTSTLSRILSEARRPSPTTLRAIMHDLTEDRDERQKLVYAHLLDELERAGMEKEVNVQITGSALSKDAAEIARMLALLQKADRAVDEVKGLLQLLTRSLEPNPESALQETRRELRWELNEDKPAHR